jgi:hypothetical protein
LQTLHHSSGFSDDFIDPQKKVHVAMFCLVSESTDTHTANSFLKRAFLKLDVDGQVQTCYRRLRISPHVFGFLFRKALLDSREPTESSVPPRRLQSSGMSVPCGLQVTPLLRCSTKSRKHGCWTSYLCDKNNRFRQICLVGANRNLALMT